MQWLINKLEVSKMEEKLFKLIEQLAADVSIIKQDVKEIKSTVTKLEEKAQR